MERGEGVGRGEVSDLTNFRLKFVENGVSGQLRDGLSGLKGNRKYSGWNQAAQYGDIVIVWPFGAVSGMTISGR